MNFYQPLLTPFDLFVQLNQRTNWFYLCMALAIATVAYAVYKRSGQINNNVNLFGFLFPKKIYFHKSAINDYLFFYSNTLFQAVLILPLFAYVSLVISNNVVDFLNLHLSDLRLLINFKSQYSAITITFILILVSDFALYFGHLLSHKIPWLWEFHKVHHSAEVLTPITVYRMHPVDNLLTFSLGGILSGIFIGLMMYLTEGNLASYHIEGVNVIFIFFYFLGYNLRHSHIWISYGRFMSNIFISPAQHQIHHSSAPEHFDKNMGFIFAFWDRLFGTLYVPRKMEKISFGLGPEENKKFNTFWSLYLMPFLNLYHSFRLKMLLEPKRYFSILVFFAAVSPAIYFNTRNEMPAESPNSVYLEDMTWKEVSAAVKNGVSTVIIPTGGTEQNGPHVILGKHNYIVKYTAGRIATELGKTLVAPVIAYVPEGDIESAEGHMRFPGTLSISEQEFSAILESTARSLKQHGFKTIAFVGDSGGNQAAQKTVAERLNTVWSSEGVRIIHVNDYYEHNSQLSYLLSNGFSMAQIGTHAGIRDTSELMAVLPVGVRNGLKIDHSESNFTNTGTNGDASKANPRIGNLLLDLKISAAVSQIKKLLISNV